MTDLQIRYAEPADADGIAARLAELGYPSPAERVRKRLAALNAAGGSAWVALHARAVVGVMTVQRVSALHRPLDDARITSLVVAEDQRREGIGRRLVETAENYARAEGCARVEVTSGAARRGAHEFYTRLGYEQNGVRFAKVIVLPAN